MATLLGMVEAGTVVSQAACKEMVAHLKACDDRAGFRRRVPAAVPMAHKGGAVDAVRTDACVMYLPSGPVVLCGLTSENEDRRWSAENAGDRLCAEVARAAYEHFNPRAPTTPVAVPAAVWAAPS